jgi:hypothetical protein
MRAQSSSSPFLKPVRVTITIPFNAYESLLERSTKQGRSLSNLAAFLLESALEFGESREQRDSRF